MSPSGQNQGEQLGQWELFYKGELLVIPLYTNSNTDKLNNGIAPPYIHILLNVILPFGIYIATLVKVLQQSKTERYGPKQQFTTRYLDSIYLTLCFVFFSDDQLLWGAR